jgi:hypothetical protein
MISIPSFEILIDAPSYWKYFTMKLTNRAKKMEIATAPIKYIGIKGVDTKGSAAARKRVEYIKRMRYKNLFMKNWMHSFPDIIEKLQSYAFSGLNLRN